MQAARNRNNKKRTSPLRIVFFVLLLVAAAYSFLWVAVTQELTTEPVVHDIKKVFHDPTNVEAYMNGDSVKKIVLEDIETYISPELSAQVSGIIDTVSEVSTEIIDTVTKKSTDFDIFSPINEEVKEEELNHNQEVIHHHHETDSQNNLHRVHTNEEKEKKRILQEKAPTTKSSSSSPSLGLRSDGRMNVLFLVADDMRSQSMVYGKETFTPNLAKLGARGVVFDRAYAQVTVCNPSRNSFLSGRIPDVTQVWNFERTVGSEMVTLPVYFRGQGYNVLGAGKIWHWAPGPGESWSNDMMTFWPDSKEYQTMIRHERALQNATVTPMDLKPDEFMDAQIAKRAGTLLNMLSEGGREETASDPARTPALLTPYKAHKQLLDQAKAPDNGGSPLDDRNPFFLAVGFHLPHEPYLFPSKTWDMYDDVEIPLLRGRIAKRPFGMPAYAIGDVQAPFSYFERRKEVSNSERQGITYGPHDWWYPNLSRQENRNNEHEYPDRMRSELLKGYCAGVTFMDSQLGKVLETLKTSGLEESTIVVFFSDHGFAMGERGQWGKRSLFESDARVPLIIADPRYPTGHGIHSPNFAELVDVFPTLTDLAGVAPPLALVPPVSGVSLGDIVRNPKDKMLLQHPPRSGSMTQFSRCPITASEFLTDISGFGPMLNVQGKIKDYRARPHHGAIAWECTWKGWEWGDHHDLSVMGYSIRTEGWRYTAWVPWDFNSTMGVWTWPPYAEELYQHEQDPHEPPGLFDELETINLLSVDGFNDVITPIKPEHRKIGKELFHSLREMVIERRGVADDIFYECNRIGNRGKREKCQEMIGAQLGFNVKLKAQLASTVDSRSAQQQRHLSDRIKAPVPTLPLNNNDDTDHHEALPEQLETSLKRLRLIPNKKLAKLNLDIYNYEKVIRKNDIVIVGDWENRYEDIINHQASNGQKEEDINQRHGIQYRVVSLLDPSLVPNPTKEDHDMILELIKDNKHQNMVTCSGDSIALGLGYMPRPPTQELMKFTAAQRKEMSPFKDLKVSECSSSTSSSRSHTSSLEGFYKKELFNSDKIPTQLYVHSRKMAIQQDASWSDRTDNIQWLPMDLTEFDQRLTATSTSTATETSASSTHHHDENNTPTIKVNNELSEIETMNLKMKLIKQQKMASDISKQTVELSRCVILDEDPMGFLTIKSKGTSASSTTNILSKKGGDAGLTMNGLQHEEGTCIEPSLEIKQKIRVHLVPLDVPPQGVRFSHLITQGLAKHPAVQLVDFPTTSTSTSTSLNMSKLDDWVDLILYLPTSTKKAPFYPKSQEDINQGLQTSLKNGKPITTLYPEEARQALVVLDEGDGNGYFPPVSQNAYLSYFKRSWPKRKNGKNVGVPRRYSRSYFPMTYSISDEYTAPMFDHANSDGHGDTLRMIPADLRRFHVSCTLRVHQTQPARTRVVDWVKKAVDEWQLSVSGGVVGEVNTGQRREINQGYFKTLASAKIIVTCNPSNWEGDFRMWEAMSSGALVFVDEMSTPMPNPPIDGEHIVVYDNEDEEGFLRKLKFYVDHPAELRRVAYNGFLHSLRYHRAVSRVDWILRSALEVKALEASMSQNTRALSTNHELLHHSGNYSMTGEKIKDFVGSDGSLQIRHLLKG